MLLPQSSFQQDFADVSIELYRREVLLRPLLLSCAFLPVFLREDFSSMERKWAPQGKNTLLKVKLVEHHKSNQEMSFDFWAFLSHMHCAGQRETQEFVCRSIVMLCSSSGSSKVMQKLPKMHNIPRNIFNQPFLGRTGRFDDFKWLFISKGHENICFNYCILFYCDLECLDEWRANIERVLIFSMHRCTYGTLVVFFSRMSFSSLIEHGSNPCPRWSCSGVVKPGTPRIAHDWFTSFRTCWPLLSPSWVFNPLPLWTQLSLYLRAQI